jgi:hypothetical protein
MGRERKSKRVMNCQQQANYVAPIDAAYTSHVTADAMTCETWNREESWLHTSAMQ